MWKPLKPLDNIRGSVIVMAYLGIIVILGVGAAFLVLATGESRTAERQRLNTIAFHIAEAGVERALNELRLDFVNDSTNPSWNDGSVNGYSISSSYSSPYSTVSFNNGTYLAQWKNDAVIPEDVWVKSTGTINNVSHTVDVYVRMVSLSPWEYAIFAGKGASGMLINGNVDIRGSVLVLGKDLNPGDYAIDLGGTAELVGNNYNGLASSLAAKVPALPTTVHNGETVSTLNAELRVKRGLVGLSGSATVGEAHIAGNAVKETVDGIYVTDGFGGNQGVSGVHSDNGTTNGYDLGEAVAFPSLNDPYPGFSTYKDYLKATGYVLTSAEATTLSNITPGSNFSYGNANGSVAMDGSGNLTVSGLVYVDNGGDLNMSKAGSNKTITYTGKGSLLVTGDVQIDVNLVTSGNSSYPTNIIGIMTPNRIGFNEASIDVMGLFYAEDQVKVEKQTDIMGTIVSNYFDMGTNVPAIYQVPQTAENLPPGMIGGDARWYLVVAWIKS